MNQNENYEFTKLYDGILPVQSLKCSDGSEVTLNLTVKVVWCYMYRKYDFYNRLGNQFYENLTDISKNLGIDTRTLTRVMTSLKKLGVITVIGKKKINGFIFSNVYSVKHPVEVLTKAAIKNLPEFDSEEPFN